MRGIYISQEIKEQVLARIKDEGVSVAEAARNAGINVKTVYSWLRAKGISKNNDILEISRLKKENKELLEIIGSLTHQQDKLKKK